jgi:hypothetical protein
MVKNTKQETTELQAKDPEIVALKALLAQKTDEILELVAKESGGGNKEFGTMILNQLANSCYPKMELAKLVPNIFVSMGGIAPKDHIEGMLAAQMLATHHAAMDCFSVAKASQNIGISNNTLSVANKLTRSYTMQMEALNRYRGKGQQKMTVEHVHINSGGQAIIGNVTKNELPQGGREQGGNFKK